MATTFGSIVWSLVGIVVSGLAGGVTGWAVISAFALSGVAAAIVAAVVGMVVATAVWTGLTVALRRFGIIAMKPDVVRAVADALLAAHAGGSPLAPITDWLPEFDVAAAYDVLREIERRRVAQGWLPVGRKIGFTNRTIWPRYDVYLPMWAHVWRETVQHAPDGRAAVSLARTVEPRIEPEVVFGVSGPLPVTDDALPCSRRRLDRARASRSCSRTFPNGSSRRPTARPRSACTRAGRRAAHGGDRRQPRRAGRRAAGVHRDAAPRRPRRRGRHRRERARQSGAGARASGARARGQPEMPPLRAGELVTTGTITDAWPIAPGQAWSSDYGRWASRA